MSEGRRERRGRARERLPDPSTFGAGCIDRRTFGAGCIDRRTFGAAVLSAAFGMSRALADGDGDAAAHQKAIDSLLTAAAEDGKVPGAVLWLEGRGRFYHKAYGSRAVEPRKLPMRPDTMFDAASLTKVVATAPSVMLLVQAGEVSPRDPVSKHIPEFAGEGRSAVTVEQLLTHTSGLPPILPREPAWRGYAKAIALACESQLRTKPGKEFRYSDVNFILLGEVVRRVGGMPLAEFARERLFAPLGMVDTEFQPPADKRSRVAPTTREGDELIQGVVHDPAARAMGGVAGHAGLFTTAGDLAKYARMLVKGGALGEAQVFRAETVQAMTRNHLRPLRHGGVKRGYGWDIDSRYSSPRGEGFPAGDSFGHTGWTGCSIWIHPESEGFVILLANRNHPYERKSIAELRADLGTLAGKALGVG